MVFAVRRHEIVGNPNLADAILNGDIEPDFTVEVGRAAFKLPTGELLSMAEVAAALEEAEKEDGEENYQQDWGGF